MTDSNIAHDERYIVPVLVAVTMATIGGVWIGGGAGPDTDVIGFVIAWAGALLGLYLARPATETAVCEWCDESWAGRSRTSVALAATVHAYRKHRERLREEY